MSVAPPQKTGAELGVQGDASNMSLASGQQTDGTLNEASTAGPQIDAPRIIPGRYVPGVVEPALISNEDVKAADEEYRSAWLDRYMADVYAQSAIDNREKALKQGQEDFESAVKEYEQKQKEADERNLAAIDAAKKRYESSNVDPTKYISNMSTGQKVMSILAVLLGGLGAALTRSDRNLALDVLNQQIDRDIEAQKVALQKNKDLYNDAIRQYGSEKEMLRQQFADRVAVIDKVFSMAEANAKTDEQRASLAEMRAQFKEGARARLLQFGQTTALLNQMSRPIVHGGGYTPARIENAGTIAGQMTANIQDPVQRMKAINELVALANKNPGAFLQLREASRVPSSAPAAAANQPTAQEQSRNELRGRLNVLHTAKKEAIAAGDYAAADAISYEITELEHKLHTGSEASDKTVERESPRYQSGIGSFIDSVASSVGIKDPASARAEKYKKQAEAKINAEAERNERNGGIAGGPTVR
jgi:hypothetical protein